MQGTEHAGRVIDVRAIRDWLESFAGEVADNRDLLTQLDSDIGDADHGANMHRGMTSVLVAVGDDPPAAVAGLLKTVGMTLVSTVGGASGPLYGTLFLRMSGPAGVADSLEPAAFAAGLRAGVDGIVARGHAVAGDKTMYDALAPACDALDTALSQGLSFGEALQTAADAAAAGRDATVGMLARKGRASYLGDRSIGHQDPGATSAAMLLAAAARTFA
jgi:dihydroxyacetone kinase-like protein